MGGSFDADFYDGGQKALKSGKNPEAATVPYANVKFSEMNKKLPFLRKKG